MQKRLDECIENATLDKKRFNNFQLIPSAHDTSRKYGVYRDNEGYWHCAGEDGKPSGACEHFKRWHTPCRHILQARYENIHELFEDIHRLAEARRETKFTDTFDDVITYMINFKSAEFCELCTLFMHLCIYQGKADADDMQDATGEIYENARIFGTVIGQLKKLDFIKPVGYHKSKRGHQRTIFVFEPTEKGIEFMANRRPEPVRDGLR